MRYKWPRIVRKTLPTALAVIAGLSIAVANWLRDALGIPTWVTYALIIILAAGLLYLYFAERIRRFKAIRMANIDSMTGIDFETYLQMLLRSKGYSVSMTQVSGDLGVDLIALGNGEKIAIQV